MNKKGFTLMELLIVVLIIGILTAIALPMYKKSVERSRVSDALTTLQAVAKSEHDWYLANNNYTKDFSDLDIELTGEIDDEILETTYYNYELLNEGIMAIRTNGEYSLYKDYEISQVMCSPSEHYICDSFNRLTKEPCQKMGMVWSNTNSTCYATDEVRCKDLYGVSMWNGEFCGYNEIAEQTLNDGMMCTGTSFWACHGSIVNNGGICDGTGYWVCEGSTVNNGGICIGRTGGMSCGNVTINSGGVCDGREVESCRFTKIYSDGICLGSVDTSCSESQIYSGGLCLANSTTYSDTFSRSGCFKATINDGGICRGETKYGCQGSTVKEGGICEANAEGACGSSPYATTTYEGSGATSGCCLGIYCPSDAPRCECTNHERKDSSGNCIIEQ